MRRQKKQKLRFLRIKNNSPRHSNFFGDQCHNAKLELSNEDENYLSAQPKSRKGSMPINVAISTK